MQFCMYLGQLEGRLEGQCKLAQPALHAQSLSRVANKAHPHALFTPSTASFQASAAAFESQLKVSDCCLAAGAQKLILLLL